MESIQDSNLPVDIADLLRRYILHIADYEGITYVDRLNNKTITDVFFTDFEVAILEGMDAEIMRPMHGSE